jgi:hypothetical protein
VKPVSLVTAGALALATALLTIAPVAPAFAAEVPDGDTLYSISDWDDPAQLYQVDPESAVTSTIGHGADAVPHEDEGILYYRSGGAAYDPTSGDAYFIEFSVWDNGGDQLEWWLGHTDLATGETDHIGRFYLDGDYSQYPVITAIAIQPDGDAYVIGGPDAGDCGCSNESYLFELDLDDATLELVDGEATPALDEWITAFAANPVTGDLIAIGNQSGTAYTVDPDTGVWDSVGGADWGDAVADWESVDALAFDSAGTPWLVINDDSDHSWLVTDGGDGPVAVDSLTIESYDLVTFSLLLEWGGDTGTPAPPTTAGGTLYSISWDKQYNAFQLFSVDPTTGASTPIGGGNGDPDGDGSVGYQPAYDATTHTVYYIADRDTDDPDNALALARINTTTGVTTIGADFWLDSEETLGDLTAMAIGPDGAAYVIGEIEDDGTRHVLFSLNLASAKLTVIDDLELDDESGGYFPIGAFTADPTTGKFYAMSRDETELFQVNVQTGYATYVASIGVDSFESSSYVLSLQIDQAGRFWMISDSRLDPDGEEGPIEDDWWVYLSSFTLDGSDYVLADEAGLLWDDPYYSSALIFLPTLAAGPSLAATGVESDALGIGAASALLLLLAGAGVLAARRRTAQR